MTNRHKIPPGILSYVKLHIYPPCELFIIIPAFCKNLKGSIPDYQIRRALNQLVNEGFLKYIFVPTKDFDGNPFVFSFPLPERRIFVKIPSVNKRTRERCYGRYTRERCYGRYIKKKVLNVTSFYDNLITWNAGRWVYQLRDNWWTSFLRPICPPKEKIINQFKKRIPILSPDWDGRGYEILYRSKPYIKFGIRYGLRMDPRDDKYSNSERHEMWLNLRNIRPAYLCPLCGAEVTYKNQYSRWARLAAREHKPECNIRIINEVMEYQIEE